MRAIVTNGAPYFHYTCAPTISATEADGHRLATVELDRLQHDQRRCRARRPDLFHHAMGTGNVTG